MEQYTQRFGQGTAFLPLNSPLYHPYFSEPRGMTHYTQSFGQGNAFSRCERWLLHRNSSIIHRIQARHLTGQDLHLQIHQHFGYRLHVTWSGNTKHLRHHRVGFERRFLTFNCIQAFCKDLQTLPTLGSCLAVTWADPFLLYKAVAYYNTVYSPAELEAMNTPPGLIKHIQEYCKFCRSGCLVQSAEKSIPWTTTWLLASPPGSPRSISDDSE
jgi:hypothetical protein